MKKKQEIEKSIVYTTCLINKLGPRINSSDEYNKAYNRLLIIRAELRKKLTEAKGKSIFSKLNVIKFKQKEKLICDYF